MYNDAIRVTKIKPEFATVLAKKTFPTKRKFKTINVKSLDEHSSLEQILGYIINFGDSPALRQAISEHIEKHSKNANAANYLLVLYACLTKDVPLLNYLVVQKKLPLRYTIDRAKKDTSVSMYWDLKTEQSIAALAAHGFAKYGQPFNTFPQLFAMSKKETWRIVRKFKTSYKKIAPIIDVEKPSQDEIDKAFNVLVEDGRIAAIAYILPKASKEAINHAFIETDNVRVLRLLIDLVQGSKLLEQKIEASIKKNSAKIVELLLPFYFLREKRAMEKDLIEKRKSGSYIIAKPAKASFPDHWLGGAYDKNAVEVMQLLAPLSDKNVTKRFFLKVVKDRRYEMIYALAGYVTDDAISTAIEEANTHGHADLAKALFEVYAGKKPVGALFFAAAEQGNLDDLEKEMPSVSVGTIGYALFKAAEKGKMDCFEKLVPHSTDEAINAALSKLPDENLKHRSVLKAINNASRLSACKKIFERATKASNVALVGHMLPFMDMWEVDYSFTIACKDKKSFEITKHLFQFAPYYTVDGCLKAAVKEKMEDHVILLLPRVKRERLVEISKSLEFKKFRKDTQQAIENRIKRFPTEIAIELAFLPKDKSNDRKDLEVELGKYSTELEKDKADLACKDQDSCIDMIKRMGPSTLIFPVEEAIERLLWEKDNAALEKLLDFVTPYACMRIMDSFSRHESEKAIKVCAGKALKDFVFQAARSAPQKKNLELIKFLVPFLSPLGIIKFLELVSSSQQIDAGHVKEILAGLPRDLADDALRIAVRGYERSREASVHYLLPKASQAAIDEVYLFAKRIKFDDETLEKLASETAKAQGKEIEGAVSTK